MFMCVKEEKEKNVYSTCLYGRSGCFPVLDRLCVAVGCVVEMCLGVLLFMLVCSLASKGRRMRFFLFYTKDGGKQGVVCSLSIVVMLEVCACVVVVCVWYE